MCICICNLSNAFFSFVSDHNDFNFVSVFLYVCFFIGRLFVLVYHLFVLFVGAKM